MKKFELLQKNLRSSQTKPCIRFANKVNKRKKLIIPTRTRRTRFATSWPSSGRQKVKRVIKGKTYTNSLKGQCGK